MHDPGSIGLQVLDVGTGDVSVLLFVLDVLPGNWLSQYTDYGTQV